MVHAYICTKDEATGYSLFYILFGRSPCLPIDLIVNIEQAKEEANYLEIAKKWRRAMQETYLLATESAYKSTAHGRIQYDKKATFTKILVGDRVLVQNMSEHGGPGKLCSFWEKIIYRVAKQHGNSPVYAIAPERGNGRTRVLHHSVLLPCDFLPVTETKLTMVDPSQANT